MLKGVNSHMFIFRLLKKHNWTKYLFSNVTFLCFYGIFLFLYELRFFRNVIPVIHPFFIGWGIILILFNFSVRKQFVNVCYWKNIIFFIVSAMLTCILSLEAGLVNNIKVFVMVTLPLLLFYPVCFGKGFLERKKIVLITFLGAAICIFISSLIALWMFIELKSETIVIWGIKDLVGIEYHDSINATGLILNGIYVDTNHAAAYAMVFVAYSILLFVECRNDIFKYGWQNKCGCCFAVINFFVQILYFPLANSRGGMLNYIVALFLVSFVFLFNYNKSKFKKIGNTLLNAILSVVLSFIIVYGSYYALVGLRDTFSDLIIYTNVCEKISFIENKEELNLNNKDSDFFKSKTKQVNFSKSDDGTGSGRLYIWKDMVVLFCERPIFGTGPSNNKYFVNKYNLNLEKVGKGIAAHNSYLELLVNYGVIGFICMMFFLLLCLKSVLKYINKFRKKLDVFFYINLFCALFVSGVSTLLSCVFVSTTATK